MNSVDPQKVVDELGLLPHPEGGYYKEIYRSRQEVIISDGVERSAGTGIYFLLPGGVISDWHRVRWDELWHFYHGDDLMLEIISQEGEFRQLKLGASFSDDTAFQRLVPQSCWQRAYSTGEYALAGCTVSPGFEFEDFETIDAETLAKKYPTIEESITRDPFL